jgi:hypothetical protein
MPLEPESADPCDVTLATYEAVADAYAERIANQTRLAFPSSTGWLSLLATGAYLSQGAVQGQTRITWNARCSPDR